MYTEWKPLALRFRIFALNDVAIGVRYGVRKNGLLGVFLYAFASPEGKNSGSVAHLEGFQSAIFQLLNYRGPTWA